MELKKGTLLQGGKYKIEQTLGQGSFGITYLAVAQFSTEGDLGKIDVVAKVAIKEFFMKDINGRKGNGSTVEGSTGSVFTNYKKRFRKEAENLSKLEHPNIVKVYDVFDENNTIYYVMEYLSDTNLNKYIKDKNGLSEKECIAITEEIGGALQYMHDSRMLHLDLKPGNIVLRNNDAVLIDFGLSKQFTADGQPESSTTIGQGTPGYAPIEQQNYDSSQSKGMPFAMDVYALGGTMFKMITGKTPPEASSILNDGFPKEELTAHNISIRLADIIEKAMTPSKKNRYQTVSELLTAINPSRGRAIQQTISETIVLTNSKAALKVGSIISSPYGNENEYVVDYVFVGWANFTYFCHCRNNSNKKVVVRELFFSDYNCRKNGVVSSLSNTDWIRKYHRRFTAFANILKTLSGHPNLENYVDSFKANGTYYVVTEFVCGETLSEIQKKEKRNFTEKEVVNIIKQICVGLGYMRTRNALHLDISPSNIIKSSNRYILIGGLFKIQSIDGSSDSDIGYTPGYSSLEQQIGSGNLTSASEVYSLGATMYKLLTGLTPKPASEISQNGFHSMETEMKKNNVSVELIKVIKIAMSSSIKNRYQSTESLSKALSGLGQCKSKADKNLIISGTHDVGTMSKVNVSDNKPGQRVNVLLDRLIVSRKISYNWISAIISLVIGSIWIFCMQNFVHTSEYVFDDLDSDGWMLVCAFGLCSLGFISYLLTKAKQIAIKRWKLYKVMAIILFSVNTLSLPLWNYSLTMAYVVLSICLLVMIFILVLINKTEN